MRRAFTAVLAAASLFAGSAALPAPALAGDRGGYDYSHSDYRRDCGRCGYSTRGYWERPGDRRGRYSHRRYRDHHGPRYYPGYGYASRGQGYRDRHHGHGYHDDRYGSDRAEWCARRYRSYDWSSGTYVTYDGRRRYCG